MQLNHSLGSSLAKLCYNKTDCQKRYLLNNVHTGTENLVTLVIIASGFNTSIGQDSNLVADEDLLLPVGVTSGFLSQSEGLSSGC